MVLALLLALYKQKINKKICLIVVKKHFIDLLGLFPDTVDKIIYCPKKYSFINKNKNIFDLEKRIYKDNLNFRNIRENILEELNLDINTGYNWENQIDFDNINLPFIPKNAIVISPYAVSCPKCIDNYFWINLATLLEKQGYNVYFNVKNNDFFAQKYKTCFFDIKTTIAFVNKCKFFIGYRSGLCDVISYFSKVKKIFIYPDNPHPINNINMLNNLSYAEIYLQSCTMEKLWNKKDVEIIYSEKTLEKILNIVLEENNSDSCLKELNNMKNISDSSI